MTIFTRRITTGVYRFKYALVRFEVELMGGRWFLYELNSEGDRTDWINDFDSKKSSLNYVRKTY